MIEIQLLKRVLARLDHSASGRSARGALDTAPTPFRATSYSPSCARRRIFQSRACGPHLGRGFPRRPDTHEVRLGLFDRIAPNSTPAAFSPWSAHDRPPRHLVGAHENFERIGRFVCGDRRPNKASDCVAPGLDRKPSRTRGRSVALSALSGRLRRASGIYTGQCNIGGQTETRPFQSGKKHSEANQS